MFIDSHAHLDMIDKQNMSSNNLQYIVHISLNPKEFLLHYPVLSKNKNILFASGIYPDHAVLPQNEQDETLQLLEHILSHYPHIALGETGIDLKNDSYGSLSEQSRLFEQQIFLAEKLTLPIIIHSRNSFEPCYRILKQYQTQAVMHCFSYTIKEAEQSLERGDYISFAGILTYKKSQELQKVAQMIPLDKILFETDSPYLSPVPVRHKSNTPEHVQYVYEYFSQLRNIPIEELCDIVSNNFKKVFKL